MSLWIYLCFFLYLILEYCQKGFDLWLDYQDFNTAWVYDVFYRFLKSAFGAACIIGSCIFIYNSLIP